MGVGVMTFDMGAVIAQVMREEAEAIQRRMDRLLVQPPPPVAFRAPIKVEIDASVPPGVVCFRHYGVTLNRWSIKGRNDGNPN